MAKIVSEGKTETGWSYKTLDNGTTAWHDGLGDLSASGPDGDTIPGSESFRTADGRVIPYTRNGCITQEAYEAIAEMGLRLDRAVELMNKLAHVRAEFDRARAALDAGMGW